MYMLYRDTARSGDDESVDEHARATPPPGPEKLVVRRRRVDDDWYERGGGDGDGRVVSPAASVKSRARLPAGESWKWPSRRHATVIIIIPLKRRWYCSTSEPRLGRSRNINNRVGSRFVVVGCRFRQT